MRNARRIPGQNSRPRTIVPWLGVYFFLGFNAFCQAQSLTALPASNPLNRSNGPIETISSTIKETSQFSDLLNEVKSSNFAPEEVLVVFDIDNTLIEPVGTVGSDQWFYYLYSIYKMQGLNEKQQDEKAVKVWNQVQSKIQVHAVEPETPQVIAKLQKDGYRTLALTARELALADTTASQLQSVQIDLSRSFESGDFRIAKKDLGTEDDALFHRGVLSVSEKNNKGTVLSAFIARLGLKPKKVVYIDDKLKHVRNLAAAMQSLKIRYTGFRYGALDKKVKQFFDLVGEAKDLAMAKLLFFGSEE